MACCTSAPPLPPPLSNTRGSGSVKPSRLSWASSFPNFCVSFNCTTSPPNRIHTPNKARFHYFLFLFLFLRLPVSISADKVFDEITRTMEVDSFVRAAWTRRSRGEAANRPNRKSWSQRTDMYMRPFLLDVFFSKRFIHAKVMHRGTSKVISVASTNSKDLRYSLPSLTDNEACRVVGTLIAERCKDADVFAMSFEPKKNERIEGRLGIVLDTIKDNGIVFV
ncbi:hypothetical protein C1H46_005466 [Malus baccata]|uniref:Uncharacterized protein n=1 Tax=Malus baccata TaxID=106549 RepID=A0A540NEP5_MALBA|nr:hypothetical protein C1H46_005466 [Malus baccata]